MFSILLFCTFLPLNNTIVRFNPIGLYRILKRYLYEEIITTSNVQQINVNNNCLLSKNQTYLYNSKFSERC